MSKKVVVITGAGSGLGASLAKQYANRKYHVCLLGRTKDKLKRTAKVLSTDHYSIHTVDVTNLQEVTTVFQTIHKEIGTVEILINNAGIGVFDLLENIDENAIHQMIDVNLKGTIFCTQAVLPYMKENNTGTIANIISTAGLEGKINETVYCASKYGARGFTESLLVELADTDIHVFGAYMGGMKTEFWSDVMEDNEMDHLMDSEDIADIIVHNLKQRAKLNVDQVVIKNH